MGRRKPRELKKLAGTLQPCRDNPGEPLRSAGTPVAPDWFGGTDDSNPFDAF